MTHYITHCFTCHKTLYEGKNIAKALAAMHAHVVNITGNSNHDVMVEVETHEDECAPLTIFSKHDMSILLSSFFDISIDKIDADKMALAEKIFHNTFKAISHKSH